MNINRQPSCFEIKIVSCSMVVYNKILLHIREDAVTSYYARTLQARIRKVGFWLINVFQISYIIVTFHRRHIQTVKGLSSESKECHHFLRLFPAKGVLQSEDFILVWSDSWYTLTRGTDMKCTNLRGTQHVRMGLNARYLRLQYPWKYFCGHFIMYYSCTCGQEKVKY